MAFIQAPAGYVPAPYSLPGTCPVRQSTVVMSVKTRRQRPVKPRSLTAAPDKPVPAIAPESELVELAEIKSDLPDELMSHSLLTPSQERHLLQRVQFLHGVQEVSDSLKRRLKQDPSDAMIANALSLTEDDLQCRRNTAIQARNRIVTANVRLVSMIADVIYRRNVSQARTGAIAEAAGVSKADLIQDGCIALIRAVERFNQHQGVRFSTYAARAVWSACSRTAVPVSCIVTLPERLRRAVRREDAAMADESIKFGNEERETENVDVNTAGKSNYKKSQKVSSEYIPDHLVRLARQHMNSGISLDESARPAKPGDRRVTHGDLLVCPRTQPQDIVEHEMLLAEIRTACYDTLPEREADILVLRFGLNGQSPLSSKKIAELHGITPARVGQLIAAARNVLREKAPYLEQLLYKL